MMQDMIKGLSLSSNSVGFRSEIIANAAGSLLFRFIPLRYLVSKEIGTAMFCSLG